MFHLNGLNHLPTGGCVCVCPRPAAAAGNLTRGGRLGWPTARGGEIWGVRVLGSAFAPSGMGFAQPTYPKNTFLGSMDTVVSIFGNSRVTSYLVKINLFLGLRPQKMKSRSQKVEVDPKITNFDTLTCKPK